MTNFGKQIVKSMKPALWLTALLFCVPGAVLPSAPAAPASGSRETLSLDGTWQIVFDQRNQGLADRWYLQQNFEALPNRRTIRVPNCWETIEQDYEGAAWYGLRFRVPASWKDRVVRLEFAAVNYRAEVWVNDQPAGFHDGGYTPFELSVGDFLHPGAENFLAVRVLGPVITKYTVLDGIGPNETPHWRGAIAGGIWQSVRLVATNQVFFSDVFVQPRLRDSRAVIVAAIENAANRTMPARVDFSLAGEPAAVRRELSLRPGRNSVQVEIAIANPKLWTPDTPALYTLEARVSAGAGEPDQVTQRFGMREFTIRDGNYYLNGKKILIKAAFWEGFYPQTLAFPPNADVVRREIRLAKEAGFNVLRLWRKPPAPIILDLADEMGIMIIDAPPIECMDYWPQLTPETEHRVAIEIRGMIERDRNHASVIYWEIFNEIRRLGLARLKPVMSVLARDLDPTRVVIDESGGWADGAHVYPPYSFDAGPINEIHSYLPAPVSPRSYNFYLTLGYPGFDVSMLGRSQIRAPNGLMFVSEVGYGGLPDLPANVAEYRRDGNPLTPDYRYHLSLLDEFTKAIRELDWGGMFPDVGALCRASQRIQAEGNKLEIEALRLNPRIGGYCVHAFTDGDWIWGGGVLDLFRNPKLTYQTIKKVQTPLYVAVRVEPSNLREGQAGKLRIDSVNDRDEARGRLEWEIVAPGGGILLRERKEVSVPSGVSSLLNTALAGPAASGSYTARVRFVPELGQPFENERAFFCLAKKDLQPPDLPVAVIDPKQEIAPFLQSHGIPVRAFSGSEREMLPVLVATDAPRESAALLDDIHRGAVGIFLKPPAAPVTARVTNRRANPLLQAGFPLQLKLRLARGNWAPVNHGVRPHPIFDGLPSGDFMGQVYLYICANQTLEGVKIPPIVGSLSYSSNGQIDRRNLNYLGPGNVWWGADLAAVPFGKGRIVLSTLRLQENLETDPVAEKVLYNMIRWASSAVGR